MNQNEDVFKKLIDDALNQDFSGWDFSYLAGRWEDEALPWDYRQFVLDAKHNCRSMLDMGTGGGEFLSSLSPFPPETHATEQWEPNYPIAKKRLEPLGVTVHQVDSDSKLPFDDETFDLVINRHESYDPLEVLRILKPGGKFITQQVGGEHGRELNLLITGQALAPHAWYVAPVAKALSDAGFNVLQQDEAYTDLRFLDIGAVVYYVKIIAWQIPDFDVKRYDSALRKIHDMIEETGHLRVTEHHFYMIAQKPV